MNRRSRTDTSPGIQRDTGQLQSADSWQRDRIFKKPSHGLAMTLLSLERIDRNGGLDRSKAVCFNSFDAVREYAPSSGRPPPLHRLPVPGSPSHWQARYHLPARASPESILSRLRPACQPADTGILPVQQHFRAALSRECQSTGVTGVPARSFTMSFFGCPTTCDFTSPSHQQRWSGLPRCLLRGDARESSMLSQHDLTFLARPDFDSGHRQPNRPRPPRLRTTITRIGCQHDLAEVRWSPS